MSPESYQILQTVTPTPNYLDMVGVTGSIPVAPTSLRRPGSARHFLFCVHVRVRLSRCSGDTVRSKLCRRHRAITILAQCRSTVGALSVRPPGRRPLSPPQAEEF